MLNVFVGTALVKNDTDYDDNIYNAGVGSPSIGEVDPKILISQGNALGVSICANANAYEESFTSGHRWCCRWNTYAATTVNVSAGGGSVGDGGSKFNVGDIVHFQETDGSQYEITAIAGDALTIRQLDNPNGGVD